MFVTSWRGVQVHDSNDNNFYWWNDNDDVQCDSYPFSTFYFLCNWCWWSYCKWWIFLLLVHYVVGQVSFQFDFNINNSISTFPDLWLTAIWFDLFVLINVKTCLFRNNKHPAPPLYSTLHPSQYYLRYITLPPTYATVCLFGGFIEWISDWVMMNIIILIRAGVAAPRVLY